MQPESASVRCGIHRSDKSLWTLALAFHRLLPCKTGDLLKGPCMGAWVAQVLHSSPPTRKTTENKLKWQLGTLCSQPNTQKLRPAPSSGSTVLATMPVNRSSLLWRDFISNGPVVLVPKSLCFNNLLSFFQGLRKRGILELAAGGLTGPRAQLESVCIATTPMHMDGNDLQSKVLWSNQKTFSKAVKA